MDNKHVKSAASFRLVLCRGAGMDNKHVQSAGFRLVLCRRTGMDNTDRCSSSSLRPETLQEDWTDRVLTSVVDRNSNWVQEFKS